MNHSVYWQKWSKKEHKISICCNGGWLRLSGLVKHDDSDTAQRGSQVHALIKYAARQVSSILTSLDAFTRLLFIRPPSQIENNSYSVIRTREKKINRGK